MQLKPFVTSTDDGTASFAVSFMGETVPVNPGQETVRINGVNFSIDKSGYKGHDYGTTKIEICNPEPEEPEPVEVKVEDAKKPTKRKTSKRKK